MYNNDFIDIAVISTVCTYVIVSGVKTAPLSACTRLAAEAGPSNLTEKNDRHFYPLCFSHVYRSWNGLVLLPYA